MMLHTIYQPFYTVYYTVSDVLIEISHDTLQYVLRRSGIARILISTL